ncbi:MAG: hypothetical protein IKP88_13490 [Lachnospiraceae bacterium]|nr:hypothetical protein [Lachnospiraceae bacterium]
MVELFEKSLIETGRQSSKGNQLKWKDNGIWFKADYTGYEGLSEYVVSHLLQKSTLSPSEYVVYEPEQIKYKAVIFNGCRSTDFSCGWQVITAERLFKKQYGISLNACIYALENVCDRLKYLTEQVERISGIKDFGKYMGKLLTIDALFLNEDRHTHNISVLMDGMGSFKLCPIYDNGAALLSDTTMDYPLGIDVYNAIKAVKAKTLCDSFEEQLDAAESLYGPCISFFWNEKDVLQLLEEVGCYEKRITERVLEVLLEQRRKYAYLFN